MLIEFSPVDVPLKKPAVLFVNVDWCRFCTEAKPLMEELATTLGAPIPVYSVNGDEHGEWIMNECGNAIKHLTYPTILFASPDGTYIKFEGERTKRNFLDFVCQHSQKYDRVDACVSMF